jgi:hypothetical protein
VIKPAFNISGGRQTGRRGYEQKQNKGVFFEAGAYHMAGKSRFRFSAKSEYPSILKRVFSSTKMLRIIDGMKTKRNIQSVTQLKK